MCPNGMFRGLPHQPDGQHLTPEGYHMLAADWSARSPARCGDNRARPHTRYKSSLIPREAGRLPTRKRMTIFDPGRAQTIFFNQRHIMPKFLRIGVHQSNVSGYTSKASLSDGLARWFS